MKLIFFKAAIITFSASAFSLGMGDLKIKSFLNQPFHGEIKLIDVDKVPLSGIQASVASPSDFERIGLSYDDDLDKLNFKVKKNIKGGAVIEITSIERINEPYLELVVDLAWSNGQQYKAYTLLLDPPRYEIVFKTGQRTSSMSYRKQRNQHGVIDKEIYRDQTVVVSSQGNVNRPESTYGPTKSKEDLYQIAQRYVTSNTTIQQVILAINGANINAFNKGNINGLLPGKKLIIPSNDDVLQIPVDLATKEIAAQDKAWANNEPIQHVLIPPYTKGIVIAPESKLHEVSKEVKDGDEVQDQLKSVVKSGKQEKSALLFSLSPNDILPSIAGHRTQSSKSNVMSFSKDVKQNVLNKNNQQTKPSTKQENLHLKTKSSDDFATTDLHRQLDLLKESNAQMQVKMDQRDRELAQLKQQMSLLLKSRQGISGQSSSPPLNDDEFPWIWILLLLIASSAGAVGYYYREKIQDIYNFHRHKRPTTELCDEEVNLDESIESNASEKGVEETENGSHVNFNLKSAVMPTRDTKNTAPIMTAEDIDRELSKINEEELKESVEEDKTGDETSIKISRTTEIQSELEEKELERKQTNLETEKKDKAKFDQARDSEPVKTAEADEVQSEQVEKTSSKDSTDQGFETTSVNDEKNELEFEKIEINKTQSQDIKNKQISEVEEDEDNLIEFDINTDEIFSTNNNQSDNATNVEKKVDIEGSVSKESGQENNLNKAVDVEQVGNLDEDEKEEDNTLSGAASSFTDLDESETEPAPDAQNKADHKKLVKSKKALDTLLSLAETYISMGDEESARQSLEEVIEYGDQIQIEAARKLLDSLQPQG